MNAAITPQQPVGSLTTVQWLAQVLRSLANRLDPVTIAPPTMREIRKQRLEAAQLALLEAEAEAERWTSTVDMLRGRVTRLSGEQ